MRVSLSTSQPEQLPADIAVVFLPEGDRQLDKSVAALDQACGQVIERRLQGRGFTGRKGQSQTLFVTDGPVQAIQLVGLGSMAKFHPIILQQAAGIAMREVRPLGAKRVCFLPPELEDDDSEAPFLAGLIVGGAMRGAYQFETYRQADESSPAPVKRIDIWHPRRRQAIADAIQQAAVVAECANWARELADTPANVMTPPQLARRARKMARQEGLRCQVFSEKQLRDEGLNLILAVGQASQYPSQLVILEYRPEKKKGKPVALVGKGVTYDTGGTNLKPGQALKGMKYDMCGAAAVLGAMRAIARLGCPVPVVAAVPIAENHLGGAAQRVGDIITTKAGISVEISNTDAEGRLLLADALTWTRLNYKPQAMVDIATLTGGCITALGHHCAGVMGNRGELLHRLSVAGQQSCERLWELPLWDEYQELLASEHADVLNAGGRPASAISGGCFISRFVEDVPWAHVDIAGVADLENSKPWLAAGATGFGVGLFVQLLQDWKKLSATD